MQELGYPSRRALADWYEEYIEKGDFHRDFIKKLKFNKEDRENAEYSGCMFQCVQQ